MKLEQSKIEEKQNNFDILRLIGAILVIYGHSFLILNINPQETFYKVSGVITSGQLGVAIFFSISGYLVTLSALRSKNIVIFLKKRILRIYPGLFFLIVTTLIIGSFATTLSVKDFFLQNETWEYFKTLTLFWRPEPWLPGLFNHNPNFNAVNGSLWTITAEFFCYLLLTLIIFYKKFSYYILTFILTVSLFLHWRPETRLELFQSDQVWYHIWWYAAMFFISGMFALHQPNFLKNKHMLVGVLLIFIVSFDTEAFLQIGWLAIPILTLTLGFTNWWGVRGFIKIKNDYSYGLYLYSFFIQQILANYNISTNNVYKFFTISLIISFVFAFSSWHFIEKPMMSLKKIIY